jgi:UDP-glucose:(heptosyl)LPS alpha-1,3-glucosyltransferase
MEKIIWDPVQSRGGPTFVKLKSFAGQAARVARDGGFDLIHSFERTWYQDVFRAGDGCHREWLRRRAIMKGPFQSLADRINPRHRAFLDLENRLFRSERLKKVLANSKQGKAEIIEHYGLPEDQIEVVYNGLDRRRFHPGLADQHREAVREELEMTSDAPMVLMVGSGFERKGLKELIKAMRGVEAALVAAGKDQPIPYALQARDVGIGRRAWFPGPRSDVHRLYGAADLFCLPSWYDPFSNACLEAMAAGLPVVTTDQTGAAEVIENGVNGYVVSFPVVSEELTEKINLGLELDREKLMAANQKILEPFDWDKNVDQTLAVYQEIAGAGI